MSDFEEFDKINELRISLGIPLKEERGVNTEFLSLINEMWELIINEGFKRDKNGKYVFFKENYEVDNPYIKNFKIFYVELGEGHIDSSFLAFTNDTLINEDNKFENVYIRIGLDVFTKKDFVVEFSHELNHLMRNYRFQLGDNIENEKTRSEIINNTLNNIENKTVFDELIKTSYYLSDVDEINARANSLFLFIYNDNTITRNNFKECIKEHPAIIALNKLRNCLNIFDNNLPKKFKQVLGSIVVDCCQLYKGVDINKVFKLFRIRLINAITKIEKHNLKVIEFAIQKGEEENLKESFSFSIKEKSFDDIITETDFNVLKYFEQLEKIDNIREIIKKLN